MFQDFDPDRPEPSRDAVDAMKGAAVLEFGANWCPICQGAQPIIKQALARHADVRHIKVEDGKGKPLGRSYKVKLWPTLIFLRDGQEIARLVRPDNLRAIEDAVSGLHAGG
ncbi:thioredoxin family protein [Bordetella bronchialis]|uniref:Thiol reductase thioredoxin n=1 Tax=Bordetella bronchialis TaxID=463025 RepID=A0A193FH91_9BORD|nr:thioredoxin family protein [Bordetella bronchialis]ANN66608.1 thiol reductase thioredoxin [Bordetella bronchialis]ANN71687.1 thiol reductase thioredoxin [Bordetella bronchialis]